jgi:hypothetical protein
MEPNGSAAEDKDKKPEVPRTPSVSPQRQKHDAKAAKILEACKWKDLEALRVLASSEGGLVSDHVRRQACSCYYSELSESESTLMLDHRALTSRVFEEGRRRQVGV